MSNENIKKESPLHYIKVTNPITMGSRNIVADEIPFLGYVNLRGNAEDKSFRSKIKKVIGFELPTEANTMKKNDDIAIYWLSPDEWLITTKEERELELVEHIRKALGETFFAVTNVSGGFTTISIKGDNVRTVLNKGTSLNINPENFKPGQCTQTQFSHTALLLTPIADNEFEIIIRRSFAEYLWLYLEQASAEFNHS